MQATTLHTWRAEFERYRTRSTVPVGTLKREEQHALDAMDTASLERIAERALLRRTDTKCMFSRELLGPLLDALAADFEIVRSAGAPVANYRTQYFDSPDRQLYLQHLRGLRPRRKVRIRHYLERDLAFLEVKSKDKRDFTDKLRLRHPPGSFHLRPSQYVQLREPLGPMLLEPSAEVHFPRITLVGRAFNERLTLDLGLYIRRNQHRYRFDHLVIAEIKQPTFKPRSPGMWALRRFQIRPASFSKYCVAMALLEDLPHKPFRSALRDLRRLDA